MELTKVCPLDVEKCINSLWSKKISGIRAKYCKDENSLPCLSGKTIRDVYILLKQALDRAVEWKFITGNPVMCDAPKKVPPKKHAVWEFDNLYDALESIDNELLHLAIHTAFACSTRPGEVLGLTWDCVNLEDKRLVIERTIQRVSKTALAKLPCADVKYLFPEKNIGSKSRLIMKLPKNDSSERCIFFTDHLLAELTRRKDTIEKCKQFFGEDYHDYNLVFCLDNGDPVEPHRMQKWFQRWQQKSGLELPNILFRELRHSSSTYKLKESAGDIKSVIGDTGHSTPDTLLRVYAQTLDSNRRELTNKLEERFRQKDLQTGKVVPGHSEERKSEDAINLAALEKVLMAIKEVSPDLHAQVLHTILTPTDEGCMDTDPRK